MCYELFCSHHSAHAISSGVVSLRLLLSPSISVIFVPIRSTTEASSVNVASYSCSYARRNTSALKHCGVCTMRNSWRGTISESSPLALRYESTTSTTGIVASLSSIANAYNTCCGRFTPMQESKTPDIPDEDPKWDNDNWLGKKQPTQKRLDI